MIYLSVWGKLFERRSILCSEHQWVGLSRLLSLQLTLVVYCDFIPFEVGVEQVDVISLLLSDITICAKKTLISLAIDLIINARWCPPPLLRLLANNLGSALPWKRYTCLYCTVLVCHPATLSWVFLACSFIPNITDLINQSINQSLHSTRTPIQFPYYHSGIYQLLSLASSWHCRPTLWVQRIFNSLLLHFISKSFSNSLSLHSIVHVSQAFNKTLN